MQQICSLLIFQTPRLDKPIDQVSPWMDQSLRPIDAVFADLAAQDHRRFIKTHTPADGLPWDERVTYLCVGRDPRDVGMSWDHHFLNVDMNRFFQLRGKAVGNDDLAELMPKGPPRPAATIEERFWQWIEAPARSDAGQAGSGFGLVGTLAHLKSFWDLRDRPNVVMLHYGELKADLEGEMRKLARGLGIVVPEQRWPELVKAATFDEMRKHASEVGPNQTENIWRNPTDFFHSGKSGQWRDLLGAQGLARYRTRVAGLIDDTFSEWVHQGPIA
jgi:hypothetical protein